MRLLAVSSALVVITCMACSGASSEPQAEEVAPTLPSPAREPAAQPGPSAGPDAGGGDGGGGGGGDGGGGGGGGGGGDGGGGGGGGGGGASMCVAGSVAEAEANDTAETANAIPGATGSACGALASATDVDHFSFLLPADATYLGFSSAYSKVGVEFDITVAGQKFTLGTTPVFRPGQTYVVKAYTTGKAPVSYRLGVEIKK